MHEEELEELATLLKSRGREITDAIKWQVVLAVCCAKITNVIGTASGMWFERDGKIFMAMRGVPHEMKRMMTEQVIPRLKQKFKTPIIVHKVIRTVGIGESILADKIGAWEKALPSHVKLAYLPGIGEVKLRITGFGDDEKKLNDEVEKLRNEVLPLVSEYTYGFGEDPLQ